MAPSVSLIVVNYNGIKWIDGCLTSIFGQTRSAEQVVVVDNASADKSPQVIRERWPQVELVTLDENVGFAAACNRGIEASHGDLVGILNNDIVLDSAWLENLLEHDRPPWGFWASRIVFASDPAMVDSAGDGMAVVGAGFKHGHGRASRRFQTSREVFGPCAAAALYRRGLLEEVGGFDEDFFLIYEDADLNFRARLAGYRCLYVPQARVEHQVNASLGTFSPTYVFYGHRNSEFVFWKNMPAALLLLYLPERLAFNLLSAVYFTLKGRGGSFLRAKFDFLRRFGPLWRKRRRVQRDRRIGLGDLRAMLTRNWLKNRRKAARGSA